MPDPQAKNEKDGIWISQRQVRASQCDPDAKARLTAICDLIQESAGDHANARDMGFWGMQSHGQAWVLNRMAVEVDRRPAWAEIIKIETWVEEMRGPFSHRHFLIRDMDGHLIVRAVTLWIAIDLKSRRPARLGERADTFPILKGKKAIEEAIPKLSFEKGELMSTTGVQYSDLDLVGHTNNVRYLTRILNSYPEGFLAQNEPRSLVLNFLKETHWGEKLEVYSSSEKEGEYRHEITSNGIPVCRANLDWQVK